MSSGTRYVFRDLVDTEKAKCTSKSCFPMLFRRSTVSSFLIVLFSFSTALVVL
jgi:hypothetical protein